MCYCTDVHGLHGWRMSYDYYIWPYGCYRYKIIHVLPYETHTSCTPSCHLIDCSFNDCWHTCSYICLLACYLATCIYIKHINTLVTSLIILDHYDHLSLSVFPLPCVCCAFTWHTQVHQECPNQTRSGWVMVKTSRTICFESSKWVVLLVLTIPHPDCVRSRCPMVGFEADRF